jgi:hypothetical protein
MSHVDAALQPLIQELHTRLCDTSPDLEATKCAFVALLEFLASPAGRTDTNCRAVDTFFSRDDSWVGARVPDAYHNIIADMSGALHDTVSRPEIAANGDSTGQHNEPPRGKT